MTQASSQSAQSPTDSLSWSRLGANATVLGQSFSATSNGGTTVSASLSGPNSTLSVVCPTSPGACSWAGPGMPAGDTLLWTSNGNNGGNGPLNLSFNHAQSGVGALIQADGNSQFTATIQAFNGGSSLGTFTATSDSKGTALYLGVVDHSGANITSVSFSLSSAQGSTADFAIDSLILGSSSVGAPLATPTRTATATAIPTRTATATPAPAATPTATPVSSSSIVFIGSGPLADYSTTVTGVSVTMPSGIRAGDVLLAQILVFDGSGSDVPTAPSGWTAIRRDSVSSGNQATSWLYYKLAGSSEPSSYSWSIASNWAAGVIGDWRGTGSAPFGGASGTTGSGSGSVSVSAPSLTPGNNNELQVYFYGAQSSSAPSLAVSGSLSQRFNSKSSKEGFSLAFADHSAPSAGVGSPSYPATGSFGGSLAMTAQAVLLVAASGSPPGSPPGNPPPAPTATVTPTPVPGGGISFIGTSGLTDSSLAVTTLTVGVPSGVRSGDTLLAQILVFDGSGAIAPSTPSGWSSLRHDSISNGNQITSWLYYRIAGSNEPPSYGWNLSSTWAAGAMGAWRGSTSLDGFSGTTKGGASPVSAAIPSMTPNNSNELLVCFFSAQSYAAPTLTLSSSLNGRLVVDSSKEGFSLGFGDIAAPSAHNAAPAYTATGSISGSLAMTAQAVLLH